MSNYDFKALNDKEFEALCTDLLGEFLGHRFERFKPGKDAGVDGRYFTDSGSEVILQCKHWANTPTSQLIVALKRNEKLKLDRLNPKRYILAISNPLSRAEKERISRAFSPHVVKEDDIFGNEDLNDLLSKFPEAERRHYKLWLHSASVLSFISQNGIMGRSDFSLEEIIRKSTRYAITENHKRAIEICEKRHVLIISGDPGVGKTTLAEHICLKYVADEFQFVSVLEDIKEAEQIYIKDTKQVFYFDDFLGRNYLEALNGHEGGHISAFIRRISKDKNKRFILTSRSTILGQGKLFIDAFENDNLKNNEYELLIDGLKQIDKGRILYNHIWHSGLSDEFREEFYINKRYKKVIDHQNFNPRIISFITDPSREESNDVAEYWPYVERSLADPSQIWRHPFEVQLDASQRAIVMLVVLNRRWIEENTLAAAFNRLVDRPGNQNLSGRHEFQTYIRLLTGSFLSRNLRYGLGAYIDIFNPSIGDYLLSRYSTDARMMREGVISLRSVNAVETIIKIREGAISSEKIVNDVLLEIFDEAGEIGFNKFDTAFVAILCKQILKLDVDNLYLVDALSFILAKGKNRGSDSSLEAVACGFLLEIINSEQMVDFLLRNMEDIQTDDDILNTVKIFNKLPATLVSNYSLDEKLLEQIVMSASDSLSDFIELSDAFHGLAWDDTKKAESNIIEMIKDKFDFLGVPIKYEMLKGIAQSIDIRDHLESFIMNSDDFSSENSSHEFSVGSDEIDDLFDRG
ncbi:restriction endonuclease [Delftia acidovorans]|uniref:nSTAND3 domain-containing NTPase n=1 Tax=Delftia acidovorans TaxID=80866 RepID=UPI00242FF4D0|nr:restriction endonuclease [Delftia acidovorans]